MRASPIVSWVGMVAAVSAVMGADAPAGQRYELRIESALKLKLDAESQTHALDARTEVYYTLANRPRAVDLTINAMHLVVKQDGRMQEDFVMNRGGMRTTSDGQPRELPTDGAPPPLQKMLLAFDTLAVTQTFDPSGRELARVPKIDGPYAPTLLGLADSLLSIHARFPEDAESWDGPVKMALGQGQSARGALRFQKFPGASRADGMVRVKVSGPLTAEGKVAKGEVKKAVYTVNGEQLYDPARGVWQSAWWMVDMAFEMMQDGKPIGTAKGALTLNVTPMPPDVANRELKDK